MPVVQNFEGPEGWERWKWEHKVTEEHPSNPLIKGLRPEFPQAFPAMLYRVSNRNPITFESQKVGSEREEAEWLRLGFVAGGQGEALRAYDDSLQTLAVAAAERSFHEQKMSPQAQAEAEKKDSTTIQHLGEIPETPIKKRRGRKPKVKETPHAT